MFQSNLNFSELLNINKAYIKWILKYLQTLYAQILMYLIGHVII